ncbi:hypothetical protein [Hydrogenophaga sp. T2]|uniref:hypothetical protein n=1 Tax=Hydrogenophaga sp. T2 TaxID=3132823 RepID=UPI003CED0946
MRSLTAAHHRANHFLARMEHPPLPRPKRVEAWLTQHGLPCRVADNPWIDHALTAFIEENGLSFTQSEWLCAWLTASAPQNLPLLLGMQQQNPSFVPTLYLVSDEGQHDAPALQWAHATRVLQEANRIGLHYRATHEAPHRPWEPMLGRAD